VDKAQNHQKKRGVYMKRIGGFRRSNCCAERWLERFLGTLISMIDTNVSQMLNCLCYMCTRGTRAGKPKRDHCERHIGFDFPGANTVFRRGFPGDSRIGSHNIDRVVPFTADTFEAEAWHIPSPYSKSIGEVCAVVRIVCDGVS
jgi:hypothetical protein